MSAEGEAVVFLRVPISVKRRLDSQLPARKRTPWVRELLTKALDDLERERPTLPKGGTAA